MHSSEEPRFAREGGCVLLSDINPKALEEVATALRLVASEASCVATVAADVSERDAAERVIQAAERPWAGLQEFGVCRIGLPPPGKECARTFY